MTTAAEAVQQGDANLTIAKPVETAETTDAFELAEKQLREAVESEDAAPAEEPAAEKEDKTPSEVVKSYKGLKRMQRKLEAERAEFEKNRTEAKQQLEVELQKLTLARNVAERLDEIRKEPKKVMDLLAEAGVSYDDLTKWKFEEINGGVKAEDPRVDKLEAELKAFREQQQRAQEEQSAAAQRHREHAFVSAAEGYSELKTFLEKVPNAKSELLASAYTIGKQMAAELGRPPSDKELLDTLEANAAAYHRSLYEALAPKFASDAGLVSAATPAKTRGAPPKAISNSHSGASINDLGSKTDAELLAIAAQQIRAAAV